MEEAEFVWFHFQKWTLTVFIPVYEKMRLVKAGSILFPQIV